MMSLEVAVGRSQMKHCNAACCLITGLEISVLGVLNDVVIFENIV